MTDKLDVGKLREDIAEIFYQEGSNHSYNDTDEVFKLFQQFCRDNEIKQVVKAGPDVDAVLISTTGRAYKCLKEVRLVE